MAYNKRTYQNTDEIITYEDMNRIEQGISDNDAEIALQKNATVPGTLAKQIADEKDASIEGSLQQQINDLKGETWEINFSSFLNGWGHGDYRTNRLRRIGNTVVGTMSVKVGSLNYGDTILVFPDSFKTQRGYDIFVKDAWFFIDSDGNLKVAGCGSFKIGDMITIPIVYTK